MKALLLDAGGTMVFPNFKRVSAELAKDGIIVAPEVLASAEAKVRFEIDNPDIVKQTNDSERWKNYLKRLFAIIGVKNIPFTTLLRIKLYHDIHNLWDHVPEEVPGDLELLAKRFRLGVISNSNGTVRKLLNRVKLAHHFEVIIDSKEEKIEKPDPRLFQIALEKMKLKPEESYYVGDIYYIDVVGARSAGMTPILIDPMDLYAGRDVARVKRLSEIADLQPGT
ncbi:MAG: HAD family hydrolase [Elusimicrobia bacterium]|nr:HAD family hydrolase [Elusimicrobiota bacterium]